MRRRHKYTQNYPSERKDYGAQPPSPPASRSKAPATSYHPVEGNPEEGGKISEADAERISSEDFPAPEEAPTSEESPPSEEKERPQKAA